MKINTIFLAVIIIIGLFISVGCTPPISTPTFPTATVPLPEVLLPRMSSAISTHTSSPDPLTTSSTPTPPQADPHNNATSLIPTSSPGSNPTLKPDEWKQLPIIPSISNSILQIYQRGMASGNNPQAFSKIGDCGSTPAWFLGDFDRGPDFYHLGTYQGLQVVIDYYKGSYGRTSLAAQSGYNASSLFVTMWSDRNFCKPTEGPLECEYRVHRPIMAFIMLGTNDVYRPLDFEPQMRRIIEFSLESGVIPILSTKADNIEKDGSINDTIARLSREYDIPLWNFWAAVQRLPDSGLQDDQAHLTWGRNFFNDPETLTKAWPIRNLNALQMLNAIWHKVNTATTP